MKFFTFDFVIFLLATNTVLSRFQMLQHHPQNQNQRCKSISLQWSYLCMLVVTVLVITGNLVQHPLEIDHLVKQPKHNVIVNLLNLSTVVEHPFSSDSKTHIRRDLSFFDCDSVNSKCTFLYPGQFYQHYNHITSSKNEWRQTIGLDNSNLPALTSLSWWTTFSASDTSNSNLQQLDHLIDEHLGLSRNLTYIHVHKCGGTSIKVPFQNVRVM